MNDKPTPGNDAGKGTAGPENKQSQALQIIKAIAAIVAVPVALFALMNNMISNSAITLAVALLLAIVLSYLVVRFWKANVLTIVVAWLIIGFAALAVFVIFPKTIVVEGNILDAAGDPIGHEKVTLTDVYGIARETITDDVGHYQFKNVPNDAYVVDVRGTKVGGKAGGILILTLITDLTLPQPTPTSTLASTATSIPTATATNTSPPTDTPTSTLTLTPTPPTIANTESLTGWTEDFVHSTTDNSNNAVSLVPGRSGNALEISYDLGVAGDGGYDVITKGIDTRMLAGTTGISFYYKGKDPANTIEFKLILRYPGDDGDTTYGILWNRATNTQDIWTQMPVDYSDFKCWWPGDKCQKHGNKIDLTAVDRLDLVVSNKAGDDGGSGKAAFDDVVGIKP